MRRQVGADTVELDTREGYAYYTHAKPRRIDFAVIEEASHDAGYTIKELILEVEGRVDTAECESCGSDVDVLLISETGQRLEVIGELPSEGTVWLRASVTGWGGSHARLTVLDWRRVE